MTFTFQKATKRQAKARVGLSGPAGAGKTYTALLLATSMCERVAVIDTEHGSASKYADEFDFDVLEPDDFHPHNYVKAIQAAENAGYDGLVIDSMSHEWSGKGGCLELVEVMAKRSKGGNKWAGWADVTPLHNDFIEAIHSAKMHIFATLRSKMDYIQTEDSRGKTVIQKVGMAPITREGAEYELDIVGEMDLQHNMVITKSRCKSLADAVIEKPGATLADAIKAWLTDGAPEAAQHGKPGVMPTPAANGNGQPRANGQTNGQTNGDATAAALRAYHAKATPLLPDEVARKNFLRYCSWTMDKRHGPALLPPSTKDVAPDRIAIIAHNLDGKDSDTLHVLLSGWMEEHAQTDDPVPFSDRAAAAMA